MHLFHIKTERDEFRGTLVPSTDRYTVILQPRKFIERIAFIFRVMHGHPVMIEEYVASWNAATMSVVTHSLNRLNPKLISVSDIAELRMASARQVKDYVTPQIVFEPSEPVKKAMQVFQGIKAIPNVIPAILGEKERDTILATVSEMLMTLRSADNPAQADQLAKYYLSQMPEWVPGLEQMVNPLVFN